MKKFIEVYYFDRGLISSSSFEKSEKTTIISIDHIAEVGGIEAFDSLNKFFIITLSNGNRLFIKPEHRNSIVNKLM
jgi:hypothetical protein